ncbi:MAG: RNA polymerase sigma factor [Flavobacteriales bacterium]|nr:RNA polymerase sigma factor [Flavobacteriales bacterium]
MSTLEFNQRLVDLGQIMEYFAIGLTHNKEEALDLTQETYLKALQYRTKFRNNVNFKAWVLTIMKNTFINKYNRKAKYGSMIQSEEKHKALMDNKVDPINDPQAVLRQKEIESAIGQVKDEYKESFLLYNKGYKYKEIAEQLDVPIGTVKSRIFLARKELMDSLKSYKN